MTRIWTITTGIILVSATTSGCQLNKTAQVATDEEAYIALASHGVYSDVESILSDGEIVQTTTLPPVTIESGEPTEYWDLSLHEAIQLALSNSQVLRDLGGSLLRAPALVRTWHDPAIRSSDPRFGVEAALSEFDTTFTSSLHNEKNDRALNNQFFGGGTRLLTQDFLALRHQLTKQSATGAAYTFRHNTDYDANNAPGNRFASVWNTNLEFEYRQPLMRGRGVFFNRVAGPNATPGELNGVVLARVNTDVQLSDFQLGIRDFLSNVENAYWDLYFAYRNLNARVRARDASLETWRQINSQFLAGKRDAEEEAQAREQYFRFQLDVENALTGRSVEGTRTNNGSSGGTFRGTPGVHIADRRLRLLIGETASDGRLIRPSDEPVKAKVVFDWDQISSEALMRRNELRKQRLRVRQRELELLASRNFLLPRLDAVGLYRFRGFGHDLIDSSGTNARFNNAYENLTSGDFQEWQAGFELSMPIGFRRAHAAIRNAELRLARDRAVAREQEREVLSDLADAYADSERAHQVLQTTYNMVHAAKQHLKAIEAKYYDAGKASLNQVLDAQRRLADNTARYHHAIVDYMVSIKNVHFEKGSLLDYNEVFLADGPWFDDPEPYLSSPEIKMKLPSRVNYIFEKLKTGKQRLLGSRSSDISVRTVSAEQETGHVVRADYFRRDAQSEDDQPHLIRLPPVEKNQSDSSETVDRAPESEPQE